MSDKYDKLRAIIESITDDHPEVTVEEINATYSMWDSHQAEIFIEWEEENGSAETDFDTGEDGNAIAGRLKTIIRNHDDGGSHGAPRDKVLEKATEGGIERPKVEHEIRHLKNQGDIYEPRTDELRVV